MLKKCIICGTEFTAPPSSKKITCGAECSAKRKNITHINKKHNDTSKLKMSEKAKGRDMRELQIKATESAKKSSKSGRFETNVSAKRWILKSPDGEIFEIRNLGNWLRKNIEKYFFLPPTDENVNKVSHGFFTIKKNIKRGKSTSTYKNWTIILLEGEQNDN